MSTSKYKWTIFAVTVIGNFIAMLDSSTVNIALYEMSRTFGVNIVAIQWVVVAYMLTLTVLLPLFGKLADIFSRNKLYAAGFLVMCIGLVCNFLSQTLLQLVASRCLEAVGASVLLASSSAIIASIFKGGKRGKALGLLGAIIALAGLSGPAIAGILINFFGWKSIFIPGIPVTLIGAWLSYKMIPTFKIQREQRLNFDYIGFAVFTVALFSMLLGVSNGHAWGWSSFRIITLLASGSILGLAFYFWEKKAICPMIDFELFKNKTFSLGCLAVLMSYLGLFANGILFPFFSQEILKFSPLVTGLLILPFSATLAITAPLSGNYAGRKGSRGLTIAGPAVMILGLIIFMSLGQNAAWWLIIIAQMISGIGNGLFQSPSNTAIICSVDKSQLGMASGILALFRNTGMIVAVSYSISLFDGTREMLLKGGETYIASFVNAYHITLFVGIVLTAICLYLASQAHKKGFRCVN